MNPARTIIIAVLFASTVLNAGEKLKASLQVKGMHCASSVSMIRKAVRKVQGVENVAVLLDSQKVNIEYTDKAALSKSIEAIHRMGYKVANDSLSITVRKPPQ